MSLPPLSPEQQSAHDSLLTWMRRHVQPLPEPIDDDDPDWGAIAEERHNPPLPRRKPQIPAPFISLGGYAGTGKTTLLGHLFRHKDMPCRGVAVVALSGKAASVLRTKGLPATTIHSALYEKEDLPGGGVAFHKRSPQEMQRAFCLIIVDEASMVSEEIDNDLRSYGVPIIYVGDHGQLPPIGKDPGIMSRPHLKLETIQRQALDSPIIRFAHDVRLGKPVYPQDIPGLRTDRFARWPSHLADCLSTRPDTQIICSTNRQRVHINKLLRQALSFTDVLHPGDRVICLRNNPSKSLYNGSIGRVLKVNFNFAGVIGFDLELETGEQVKGIDAPIAIFGQEKLNLLHLTPDTIPFDYAYAITCHKAQGSEWDNVLVCEHPIPLWTRERWLYTAATRAKKHLTHLCP